VLAITLNLYFVLHAVSNTWLVKSTIETMALFQSRNQMGGNKNDNQAQMLMLLSQVTNLENQLRQTSMPQTQTMGVDPNNLLNVMSQLKSLQGNLPTRNGKNVPQGKKQQRFQQQLGVPAATTLPNFNTSLAGLLASMGGNNAMDRTRCIWVTGLPEDYQDADKLINIFGNFGNVRKVVFSEKKPDGALIEMDDPRAAWKCCACMNKMKLNGQEIKVAGTKIDNAIIKSGDTKSRDVRQAKENWRYSKDGKFRRIIMSRLRTLSSNVLVTNLPEGKSDQLKKEIIEAGYTVKSITEGSQRPDSKEKPSTGYTMALVELASVEEAIAAVANLHNTWPKKFGTKKNDNFGRARGLVFSLAGTKKEKPAEKSKA
jgi:hypothetical protein